MIRTCSCGINKLKEPYYYHSAEAHTNAIGSLRACGHKLDGFTQIQRGKSLYHHGLGRTISQDGLKPSPFPVRPQLLSPSLLKSTSCFGCPLELVFDQGREFLGEVNDLLTRGRVIHRTTSAYRAQANGMIEHLNGALGRALIATLEQEDRRTWERGLFDFLTSYWDSTTPPLDGALANS